MQRSLHGDRDHPGIAATLFALGQLSSQAGDLPAAKKHLEDQEPWKKAAKFHSCGFVSVWSLFLL